MGRPAWLFTETVHRHCPRAGYYEEGVFAHSYGDKECLVELGCWGPVVQCNIAERGIVDGHGGCMNMGGICIGCTMPASPTSSPRSMNARPAHCCRPTPTGWSVVFVRRMRQLSQRDKMVSARWEDSRDLPSGWRRYQTQPVGAERLIHKLYSRKQHSHEGGT